MAEHVARKGKVGISGEVTQRIYYGLTATTPYGTLEPK